MRGFALSLLAAALAGFLALLMLAALLDADTAGGCSPKVAAEGEELDGLPAVAHEFVPLYIGAASRYKLGGVGPAVLASIHRIETDFSRNVAVSSAGALGHMQFMPGTWAAYGVDADGDGRADPYTLADAIFSSANYLRASGAPGDWRRAIFAYNHAQWYVDEVLDHARRYGDLDAAALAACDDAALDAGGQLAWPVRGPVTSPFGMRWGRLHAGVDIGVRSGTPIRAAAAGRVVLAAPTGGYGNYVCMQHSARLSTCYAHLSAYRARNGQTLGQGQVLGLSGCSGRCFGDHLHFEVRLGGARGEPVDPMPYLSRGGRS